jgi:hypothetical protein
MNEYQHSQTIEAIRGRYLDTAQCQRLWNDLSPDIQYMDLPYPADWSDLKFSFREPSGLEYDIVLTHTGMTTWTKVPPPVSERDKGVWRAIGA